MAEEKLVELLPLKEKKRYLSLSHKTTPAEIAEAESELNSWRKNAVAKDETILGSSKTVQSKKVIPVRGSGGATNMSDEMNPKQSESSTEVSERLGELLSLLNGNQKKKFVKLQTELGVEDMSSVKRQYRAGKRCNYPTVWFIHSIL